MTIPLNYGQVTFLFTGSAVPTGAAITFGVGPGDWNSPGDIAESAFNAWDDAGGNDLMVAECVLTTVRGKVGPVSTGAMTEISVSLAGTASGEAGYVGASLLVRKNTNLGGRANTGRFFVPGIAEAAIEEGGGIEGGYLSGAQTVMDGFLDNLLNNSNPSFCPMVVLHQEGNAQPPEVLTLEVQARAATQRRRQRR